MTDTAKTPDHASLMDGIYKSQRHIYDLTRKYYLLGRDQLIDDLKPESGERVLEVGCGTGRNLITAARKYPWAKFYGFDISEEMLTTARTNINKAGFSDRITLVQGDASNFDINDLFGIDHADRVFFSYTLSMIPPWEAAIAQGLKALSDNGSLHIVDFGKQENMPGIFRHVLLRWLALFHVEPRTALAGVAAKLTEEFGRSGTFRQLYRGYSWSIEIR